jgi:hypothetical protein
MALFYPIGWYRNANRRRTAPKPPAAATDAGDKCCPHCGALLPIAPARAQFRGRRRVENVWVCSQCGQKAVTAFQASN